RVVRAIYQEERAVVDVDRPGIQIAAVQRQFADADFVQGTSPRDSSIERQGAVDIEGAVGRAETDVAVDRRVGPGADRDRIVGRAETDVAVDRRVGPGADRERTFEGEQAALSAVGRGRVDLGGGAIKCQGADRLLATIEIENATVVEGHARATRVNLK